MIPSPSSWADEAAQRQCGAVDYVTGGSGTDSWIALYRTFTDFRGEMKELQKSILDFNPKVLAYWAQCQDDDRTCIDENRELIGHLVAMRDK